MKVIVFEQWDKLTALMRRIAASSASEKSQYAIKRVQTKDGRAHLDDRTANVLAIEGGTTTVVMPDIEPGKARDFMMRVTASGENTLLFKAIRTRMNKRIASLYQPQATQQQPTYPQQAYGAAGNATAYVPPADGSQDYTSMPGYNDPNSDLPF